jgi:hypothetical protein
LRSRISTNGRGRHDSIDQRYQGCLFIGESHNSPLGAAQKALNFGWESFDTKPMDLARFTSFYRRDSDEVIGAVRLSAVETIAMEQMPGGRFQIIARTAAGSDGFVSCVMGTLGEGQEMLLMMREYLGGEGEVNPAERFLEERDQARIASEAAEAERVEAEQAELRDSWEPPST